MFEEYMKWLESENVRAERSIGKVSDAIMKQEQILRKEEIAQWGGNSPTNTTAADWGDPSDPNTTSTAATDPPQDLPRGALFRLPGGAPATTSGAAHKPNEALKPYLLSRGHSPMELREWIDRFRAYHSTSRMDLCSIQDQQGYFRNSLELALFSRIKSLIKGSSKTGKTKSKGNTAANTAKTHNNNSGKKSYKCYRCGDLNDKHDCQVINYCSKSRHFASVCNKKKSDSKLKGTAKAHHAEADSDEQSTSTNAVAAE